MVIFFLVNISKQMCDSNGYHNQTWILKDKQTLPLMFVVRGYLITLNNFRDKVIALNIIGYYHLIDIDSNNSFILVGQSVVFQLNSQALLC